MNEDTQQPGTTARLAGFCLGVGLFVLILALPAPAGMPEEAWRATALVALMAGWWFFEVIPIAATALLPLALVPALGLAPIGEVAEPYANPLVFLLLGGFLLGLAMQRCGLHLRVALMILRLCGSRGERVVAGFMVATAILSMWISNTATTAIMAPIALSVIAMLDSHAATSPRDSGKGASGLEKMPVVLMLGIAFGANIGGMGTLIGTPPNAVLAAYMERSHGVEIGFAQWMVLGIPVAALTLLAVWQVLTRVVYPVYGLTLSAIERVVAEQRQDIGPMRAGEKRLATIFGLTVLAWLFRPLIDDLLPGVTLTDAGIAVTAGVLLFLLPDDWKKGRFLLDWDETRRLPWGVLLLIGGGLSLGAVIEDSGLAAWVGDALGAMEGWPLPATVAVIATATMLVSHVTSNTATAAAMVPVAAALAISFGQAPILFTVPLVLAASCAFMLPVATPPNAIVHGTGKVSTPEMAKAGAAASVVSLAIILLASTFLTGALLG